MNGQRWNRNEWIERSGDLVVASFAVAAAIVLLSGCGGEKSGSSVAQTTPQPAVENAVPAVATTPAAPALNAALGSGATRGGAVVAGERAKDTDASLPPEIALGEIDTLVTPGQAVHVTVYGTPDIVDLSLSDGRNDHQALVHDAQHDTWSVDYRVPLRSKSDRIGLAVTAKNATNRWRRVWVFLKIGTPAGATAHGEFVPATVDSIAAR